VKWVGVATAVISLILGARQLVNIATDRAQRNRESAEFTALARQQAARNEFASGAMGLMHGLSRRFWFMHHRQADDTQPIAVLHARISQAIADGDETLAAKALDELIDHNEAFTRATVSTDF